MKNLIDRNHVRVLIKMYNALTKLIFVLYSKFQKFSVAFSFRVSKTAEVWIEK